MNEVLYLDDTTILIVLLIMLASILISFSISCRYRDSAYYSEIENLVQSGYVVYVDGSAVDFDKIVINDYSTDRIHINDELKEIYISVN